MVIKEIIIALTIHLIIPLVGFLYFQKLKRQMIVENVVAPPTRELFVLFATYGGLLLVILTSFFWYWSGMASLGTFYLILGAPIVTGLIAYKYRQTKMSSRYHKWTYILGLIYFPILLLFCLLVCLFGDIN